MTTDPTTDSYPEKSLHVRVHALMTGQPYGVLCTQGAGQPYGSLIAFSVNSQLNAVVFATPTATHKYRLLSKCNQVALVIDNRGDVDATDNTGIDALTATGQVVQLDKLDEIEDCKRALLQKHPHMHSFIVSSDNAYFQLQIQRYVHVTRLNEVNEWLPPQVTECC